MTPTGRALEAQVTNVSPHGIWLMIGAEELFLPYEQFPWFRTAAIEQIASVRRPTEDHLYWPVLDIDLSIESIRDPSKFPLVSKSVK
jgi:hypothetical protein